MGLFPPLRRGAVLQGANTSGAQIKDLIWKWSVFPVKCQFFFLLLPSLKRAEHFVFFWCYCVLHFFIASDDDGTSSRRSPVTLDIKATVRTRWWNTGRKTDNMLAENLLTSISCWVFSPSSCERRQRRAAKVSINYLSDSRFMWSQQNDFLMTSMFYYDYYDRNKYLVTQKLNIYRRDDDWLYGWMMLQSCDPWLFNLRLHL